MDCDSSGLQTQHQKSLNGLCRICGERAKRKCDKVIPKLCTDYKTDIFQVYRLIINGDNANRHSTKLCYRCYTMMKKALRTKDVKTLDNTSQRVVNDSFWSLHTDDGCNVCTHYAEQDKGGRPATDRWLKKRQRDASDSPPFFNPPDCSTPTKQKVSVADAQTSPFQTPSSKYITRIDTQTSPIRQDANATNLKEQSHVVDCQTSPVKQLQSECISDSLSKHKQEPLSNLEEKLATSLLRRKQNSSANKDIISYKTGGLPLTFMRIPKSRKHTSKSMAPKRSRVMETARSAMAGTSNQQLIAQHKAEIKRMNSELKSGVQQSVFKQKTVVNKKVALAIKILGGLSVTQFRAQKRLLKQACNIAFEGEEAQRKEEKEIQAVIHVENHQLFFNCETVVSGKELKSTPCVYVTDLDKFVTDTLDTFEAQHLLTWHDNAIPEDQIWIKVGGDHGGGSFKMSLQIANVQSPNSKHNTFMICMANAKDSRYNLREILCTYRKEIDALENLTWKGKKIKLFMFGNYDFLCNVYGLSGAAGTFPCVWCYTTKSKMQKSHTSQPQVLDRHRRGIKRNYCAFKRDGKDKKKAANYHNVISCPVFQMELDRVCPPYLHIVLGIVKKHHALLEERCHKLDQKLADCLAHQEEECDVDDSTHFGQHVTSLREKQRKSATTRKANDIVGSLKYRSGPIAIELDKALGRHKIDVQSFHGRSFTGNHCNKYMKDTVFRHLLHSCQHLTKTSQ